MKPIILCILDGWGFNDSDKYNAIALANTPNYDRFLKIYQHNLIGTDGPHVGLPVGQMGNSEVGHMNIGAGSIALPEFGRIDAMIGDDTMRDNAQLKDFIKKLQTSGGVCHLMGLLSKGGVHSHQSQISGLAKIIADSGISVKIHAFSDGRDMPPQSAIECFSEFMNEISNYDINIATISGRFYAMDRDNRWERVELAYNAIVNADGGRYNDVLSAINQSYDNKINDEFILPSIIGDYNGMNDGDGVLMANFRADRAREIFTALLDKDFNNFTRHKIINFAAASGVIKYSTELEKLATILVPPIAYPDGLGETLSKNNKTQLRIAETEKYAHVTFFFSGGIETPFTGEDRILVPSPKVRTYDLKPEMSAFEVTTNLLDAIDSDKYDYIIVNYANADMVGHTGNQEAAIHAIEALDICLGRLEEAITNKQGIMFITADHGNAELMFDDKAGMAHTQHTTFMVPLVFVDPLNIFDNHTLKQGKLADIAPTLLYIGGIDIPKNMTGNNLLVEN